MEEQVSAAMSDKVESHPFNFTANGQRRRYDEDYKEFVKTGFVECECSRILPQFARATGHASEKTVVNWRSARVAELLAEGWRSFGSCRILGCVFDASRIGNPAEDVVVFAFEDAFAKTENAAIWGAPMVLTRSF